ncbi:RING finger protein [Schistosoma japonicum]|nr:RING finger protein [Schistosoma japonicum]
MKKNPDVIVLNNVTYHLSKLSAEEKFRIEHLKFHEDHKDHEKMHLKMFLIALFSLLISQLVLMLWKQRHFYSYQLITLIAMWLVPLVYSVFANFRRFIFIWLLFSLITGVMTYLASKKLINPTTPRRVYRWFLFVHTTSYVLGVSGYVLLVLTFFQVNLLFLLPTKMSMDLALLILFYGLYYGVIARDFAEVCTNKLAARISYRVPEGMPVHRIDPSICSICRRNLVTDDGEKVHRLNCTHVWDKPHILYGNLLDWVRYLVAWQPVILAVVHFLNSALGLQ